MSSTLPDRLLLRLLFWGLAVGLLLLVPSVQAQVQQPESRQDLIRFERIGVADGLVDSFVRTFLQDRQGFLWIGTNIGLDRYDGYTFEHMLPGLNIWALAEDREGGIWAGRGRVRGGGLSRYDPVTGRFSHFFHDPDDPFSLSDDLVRALYVDHTGTLWVGTSAGLDRFDPMTSTFTHYQHDPGDDSSLSMGTVLSIYEDRVGVLWIGTEGGGLNHFNPATETFTHYRHNPGDPHSLTDDEVWTIKEDRQGTLYVGTCQHGLHRYDRIEDRFERLTYDPTHPARPHAPQGEDIPGFCGAVRVIDEDATGAFWVGTETGGLKRFDREHGTVTHYVHDPLDPHSLSATIVSAFYEDRQGTRWVATDVYGINKIVPDPAQMFRPLAVAGLASDGQDVQAAFEDASDQLWIGMDAGDVYRVEASDTFSQARLNHVVSLPSLLRMVIEDPGGVVWGGNLEGLYRFDPKTGDRKRYAHDPNDPASLSGTQVHALHIDAEGVLWVGTNGGISRLDRKTDTFTRYLPGHLFPVIYEDRRGALWVGSADLAGLYRYDPDEDRFTLVLPEVSPLALYEDAQGRFWVGTHGTGLLLLDRDRGTVISSFTTEDGLVHDNVWGIADDDHRKLWLSTAAGLSQFDPKLEQFVDFTEAVDFLEGAGILKRRNGEIVIRGKNGVTMVLPDRITTNPHAPEVIVTGLEVFDEPLQAGGLFPASVELAHDQNDLTFGFVGIHYADPEENRYQYRLLGYDQDWRSETQQRRVTYTNLEPGDYTFEVKAANSDGIWTPEAVRLGVEILPPWWRTIWAYLLYGLLLVGAVFMADQVQRRRLIRRERQRAEVEQGRLRAEAAERELEQAREIEKAYHQLKTTQVQLVQQEKMASLGALTAGIAHEIKNPLNFINNFAEVNEELADELREAYADNPEIKLAELLDIVDDLKQNAGVINQHGKRADGIVHAMMQHASGGAGQRTPTDINQLVLEHIDLAYHGKRAQMTGFNATLERDLDAEAGAVEMVPQEIGRVLLNLLSNAFDAVHEHAARVNGQYEPTVTISTRRTADTVEIRVRDNGPGIPEDVRDRIFEPFFTTKPTGSGTGLGLSLSYDIVTQGHGGALTVESKEGEGALFLVTLPAS